MDDWRTADVEELIAAFLRLEDRTRRPASCATSARSASCATSPSAGPSSGGSTQGEHYAAISRETGASTATITRIATWLNHGEGGYRQALDRLAAAREAGIPYPAGRERDGARGRASACGSPSPTRAGWSSRRSRCCATPGLVFEEHERSLVARVRNFDLDILFVRTNDVIEFVGDGVADLGVTGEDLLAETGAELPRLRSLGYGQCRLAAAVPADSAVPERRRPRRPPRRDRPPEHHAPLLRAGRASPSTSSRSPARSRSPRGSAWPRRSSISSRPARRS